MSLQRLYGLVVDSAVPLHQDRHVPAGTPVDVTVRWGAEMDPQTQHEVLPGTVLLEVRWGRAAEYLFVRHDDGRYTLRFMTICDFVVSPDLARVTVHPVRGADRGIAEVLTTGAMLAFQLYARGHAVLHASAVAVGDRAIAFVGPSGQGKSTMATLLCSQGAGLITDDVLHVEDPGGLPLARLGATELRLRKGADTLAALFTTGGPDQRRSADDRQVLTLSADVPDRLPLAAIVVPRPDRRRRRIALTRRPPREALFDLLGYPRLLGWQDPTVLAEQFTHLGALVDRVPVFEAAIPWGPPFDPAVPRDLLAALLAEQPAVDDDSSASEPSAQPVASR